MLMDSVCKLMEESDVSLEIDDLLNQYQSSLGMSFVVRVVLRNSMNLEALLRVMHELDEEWKS